MIKDDEGDSIDPFLTDEQKAGLPVATDVEWTFDKKFITCKFSLYINKKLIRRAFKVDAIKAQKPCCIHIRNTIERLLLHPRMGEIRPKGASRDFMTWVMHSDEQGVFWCVS